ncbi:unnamed protein product, partial [Larinioides sclopetarius]
RCLTSRLSVGPEVAPRCWFFWAVSARLASHFISGPASLSLMDSFDTKRLLRCAGWA